MAHSTSWLIHSLNSIFFISVLKYGQDRTIILFIQKPHMNVRYDTDLAKIDSKTHIYLCI